MKHGKGNGGLKRWRCGWGYPGSKVSCAFVIDHCGLIFIAEKVRGVIHHSSLTRGHCCRIAGGLTITDGKLEKLTPHSGHYMPSQDDIQNMIRDWEQKGVDFSQVKIKPYLKE